MLYGCENQSLAFRKEVRLRIFENNCLKLISGHTSETVTGNCRKIHKKELQEMYSSPNIIFMMKSRIKLQGFVASMGVKRDE